MGGSSETITLVKCFNAMTENKTAIFREGPRRYSWMVPTPGGANPPVKPDPTSPGVDDPPVRDPINPDPTTPGRAPVREPRNPDPTTPADAPVREPINPDPTVPDPNRNTADISPGA